MKIALGADHGGFKIKEVLREALLTRGLAVEDLGCYSTESVDYPDYAGDVAAKVAGGTVDQGILVCTTGIGMTIAANKCPKVRAALCLSPDMAAKARTHNDANVLVLGESLTTPEDAKRILDAWLSNAFSGIDRHQRRISKITKTFLDNAMTQSLSGEDPELYAVLRSEEKRQAETLNLIASENHVSRAVRESQASVLTNKYAEGYPGKRWYNGCENADAAELLAIERARELFGAEHVNVQSHCGSSANMAVYFAALEPGDTIMAMRLDHGGHLTHGHSVNFSGRLFNIAFYGVDQETEVLNYDELEKLAVEHKPKLIVAGASAYSRVLDFERFRAIADSVGAKLMVDMAHIAGLVAGGSHPSPVPHAEFVTTTTHKTLRGPRSGMVLCREEFAAEIDRQVFPGTQGGPLMHTIASKAVCFREALQPSFKEYARQVVVNSRAMAASLVEAGFRLVSGGTDNHLMLVDMSAAGLTGKDAAAALDRAGIIVNKNTIPFDTQSPFVTSGIRIGTPSVTTRGMREADVRELAALIVSVLRQADDVSVLAQTRRDVRALAARFPMP